MAIQSNTRLVRVRLHPCPSRVPVDLPAGAVSPWTKAMSSFRRLGTCPPRIADHEHALRCPGSDDMNSTASRMHSLWSLQTKRIGSTTLIKSRRTGTLQRASKTCWRKCRLWILWMARSRDLYAKHEPDVEACLETIITMGEAIFNMSLARLQQASIKSSHRISQYPILPGSMHDTRTNAANTASIHNLNQDLQLHHRLHRTIEYLVTV